MSINAYHGSHELPRERIELLSVRGISRFRGLTATGRLCLAYELGSYSDLIFRYQPEVQLNLCVLTLSREKLRVDLYAEGAYGSELFWSSHIEVHSKWLHPITGAKIRKGGRSRLTVKA